MRSKPKRCDACGKVWQARSADEDCPACAEAAKAADERKKADDKALVNTLAQYAAEPVVIEGPDDTRECPRCAERIKVKAKACKHCGVDLEELARAEKKASGPRRRVGSSPEEKTVRVQIDRPTANPGVAAVLSFLIPGLGQMYSREIVRGILILVFFPMAANVVTLVAGFGMGALVHGATDSAGAGLGGALVAMSVVGIVAHLAQIFDAYYCAERANQEEAGRGALAGGPARRAPRPREAQLWPVVVAMICVGVALLGIVASARASRDAAAEENLAARRRAAAEEERRQAEVGNRRANEIEAARVAREERERVERQRAQAEADEERLRSGAAFLDAADRAERAGRIEQALDLLGQAVENGAPPKEVQPSGDAGRQPLGWQARDRRRQHLSSRGGEEADGLLRGAARLGRSARETS